MGGSRPRCPATARSGPSAPRISGVPPTGPEHRAGWEVVPHPGLPSLPCLAAGDGEGARTGPAAREHLARLRPPRGPRLRRGTSPRLLRAYDTASPVVGSPSPRPVCRLSAAPPGSSRLVGRRIDRHTERLPTSRLPASHLGCPGWRLPDSAHSSCHRGRTPPHDTAEEGGKKGNRDRGHPGATRPSTRGRFKPAPGIQCSEDWAGCSTGAVANGGRHANPRVPASHAANTEPTM